MVIYLDNIRDYRFGRFRARNVFKAPDDSTRRVKALAAVMGRVLG